jgi:hypothetical protein
MRVLLAALAIVAAVPATAAPKLDMVAFFTGKTHGENVMKVMFKRPAKLVTDSFGGKGDRGDFVLIDTVHEERKPVRTRKWIMKPAGPNHYTGSLSDAVGPVDVTVDGDTAIVRYAMKGGIKVEQKMQLRADGKTLTNMIIVKKLGLKVAQIDGAIRKLD